MTSLKAFKESLHKGDKVKVTNYITAFYKPEVATQERIILHVGSDTIVTGALLTHDEAIDCKLDKWHENPVEYEGNYYSPIRLTLQKVKDTIITDNRITLLATEIEGTYHAMNPSPDFKVGEPWFTLEMVVD